MRNILLLASLISFSSCSRQNDYLEALKYQRAQDSLSTFKADSEYIYLNGECNRFVFSIDSARAFNDSVNYYNVRKK